MFDDSRGYLTRAFLQREWALDYTAWRGSAEEEQLVARLTAWAARPDLKERSSEGAFVQTFFVETWGYQLGGRDSNPGFTAYPGYPVAAAGAGGSTGEADLALGWFGESPNPVPQVLCEFKDIRSGLDTPQARKGNTRSPVKQCLDYVNGARRGMFGNEPLLPWWGLVTDMNEFRLYWWDRAPQSYLRFVIRSAHPLLEPDLTASTAEASFDRFVFSRLFQRDRLLSRAGRPPLLRLIEKQGGRESALEGEFYADYRAVRERLFNVLRLENPSYASAPSRLLRLAQKILDRFIFAFYCEDMGERMLFPPQLIRDLMKRRSLEDLYDEGGDELWRDLSRLFRAMDAGGRAGQVEVRGFNGGLFRHDPDIDSLAIPNHFFCRARQGTNPASIEAHRDTLLHLCASYNYAARGDVRESISLYTLGRIFEQSITELEIQEAKLEGRLSLAEVSKRKVPKRKRDGVFYTPEWVVERVVEGALGAWFEDQKRAVGWEGEAPADLEQLSAYEARVCAVRIVDPACGSGAFLIGAFRRVLKERIELHGFREALSPGRPYPADEKAITASILDGNLFGVDINAAAVEIAKLAVWLHSVRADSPLSSLDGAITCGNSLVGLDYYDWTQVSAFTESARDQVNAFDWHAAFPNVFANGGFDVVVGNPPYVKLQNIRQVDSDVANYLVAARENSFYASTQTGNFDLYLPFIEKGLTLLRPGGRLGYIAPSIWTVAEYGEGLRNLIRQGRQLDRWVDFKSHQIFKEATTYTALQFFTQTPNEAVKVAPAPNGEPDLADVRWEDPDLALPYARLPYGAPWLMATGEERALIDRLAETCLHLGDRSLTTHIFQGLITSADSIYHLKRIGIDRYLCSPDDAPAYDVGIEDAIMRPLISGPEAKRYETPDTDTYILFPYQLTAKGRMALIPQQTMSAQFARAWTYLQSWEEPLRSREAKTKNGDTVRPFDDDQWYRFGRNQNMDKQERKKLIVAQTVPGMRVCIDLDGSKYLNNVRVNGILAPTEDVMHFLLGVLNGPVADYVFRRMGKPKAGGWFEANKQFISPLPVPRASTEQQAAIGRRAIDLQEAITVLRDQIQAAAERLGMLGRSQRQPAWLWPDLPDLERLDEEAPRKLRSSRDRREWAKARLTEAEDDRQAALQAHLDRRGRLDATFSDGELRLLAGGTVVLRGIYLDEDEGALTLAYWRWLLLQSAPTTAKDFAADLRRPPAGASTPAARQFIAKVADIEMAKAGIAADEAEINALLFDLYGLTSDERALINSG